MFGHELQTHENDEMRQFRCMYNPDATRKCREKKNDEKEEVMCKFGDPNLVQPINKKIECLIFCV